MNFPSSRRMPSLCCDHDTGRRYQFEDWGTGELYGKLMQRYHKSPKEYAEPKDHQGKRLLKERKLKGYSGRLHY